MKTKSKISMTPRDRSQPHHQGVLFLQGIPQTTKSAFKAECARREETMRDAVIRFMRRYATGND